MRGNGGPGGGVRAGHGPERGAGGGRGGRPCRLLPRRGQSRSRSAGHGWERGRGDITDASLACGISGCWGGSPGYPGPGGSPVPRGRRGVNGAEVGAPNPAPVGTKSRGGGGSGPPPSRHILSCDRCPGNLYPPLPERPDEHPGTAAAPCQEQPAWHSPHARTPPSPAPHTPLSSPDPQPPGVPRDARPSPGPEEGQRCCRCCRHGGEGLWCEAGGSFKGPAPAPALLWHLSPGDPTKTTPPAPTLPRCQPRQARTKPAPRPLRPRGASVPPGPLGTQSPSRWPPAQTGMVTGGKAPTKGLGGHNLSRGWQLGGGH